MTTKNPKILQLEAEIQTARSNSSTEEVKELLAKFNRKYEPTPFTLLVQAELAFEHKIPFDEGVFVTKCNNEKSKSLLQKALEKVESGSTTHQEITILLALCELLEENPVTALKIIMSVNSEIIDYFTIKAWIYHTLGQNEKAREVINEGKPYISSSPIDRVENWTFAYVNMEIDIEQAAQEYLDKHYQGDTLKKIRILERFLEVMIQNLGVKQPLSGLQVQSRNPIITDSIAKIIRIIRLWLPKYEQYVTQYSSFPNGGEQSDLQINRLKRVEKVFDWWVFVEMYPGKYADDGIGDIIDRHYHLLETLYRGTKHTFLSLRILSLMNISRDSLCLDEKTEARLAVQSYVFHWEKKFTLLLDAKMKERRDREIDSDISPPQYKSHRMSGQISQMPLMNVHIYEKNMINENEVVNDQNKSMETQKVPKNSQIADYNRITISYVENESVEDVVGVLITGMWILLKQHEGRVELLNEAAVYGEKAFIVVSEHGRNLPNVASLFSIVFKNLGLVYGELALEVTDSKERQVYQDQQVVMFKKALDHEKNAGLLYYLSLALAETKEFEASLKAINEAIELDPYKPNYYNLLALLLSSRSQYFQASEVAMAGWSHCVAFQAACGKGKISESNMIWSDVEPSFKEDLLNLRLTYLAMEMKLHGPKAMVETLLKTFVLFKKIIGNIHDQNNHEPLSRRASATNADRSSLFSAFNSLAIGKTNTTNPKSISVSFINEIHRLRSYDLQISLWLTLASVYCELNLIEKSLNAVQEAERLLLILSSAHNVVRHQASRVHREIIPNLSGSSASLRKEALNEFMARSSGQSVTYSGGFWKDTDPAIGRIEADIALQRAFIKYNVYKVKNAPKPPNKYSRYVSLVARAEADMQAAQRLQLYKSLPNMNGSADSLSITATIQTDAGSNAGDSSFDVQNELTEPTRYPKSENSQSLSQVIQDVHAALLFDSELLPARAFLGMLYREKGDLSQSEHHLELACTQNPHRGSGSGRTGLCSVFGGATSIWGWYSWKLLSQVFKDQGQIQQSKKAALYAMDLQSQSPLRGFESLTRF